MLSSEGYHALILFSDYHLLKPIITFTQYQVRKNVEDRQGKTKRYWGGISQSWSQGNSYISLFEVSIFVAPTLIVLWFSCCLTVLVLNHHRHSGYHEKSVLCSEWCSLQVHPVILPFLFQFFPCSTNPAMLIFFCFRKENEKAKELFDALNKLKEEFESIEKPVFEVDSPTSKSVSPPPVKQYSPPPKHNQEKSYPSSYPQPKLESLGFESEENSRSSSNEDITDWECDLVLREPQPNC